MRHRFQGVRVELNRDLDIGELEVVLDNCKLLAADTKLQVQQVRVCESPGDGELLYVVRQRGMDAGGKMRPDISQGYRHEDIQRRYSK